MKFIHSGGLLTKDPSSEEPFFVDWGREDRVGPSVGITSSTWGVDGPDSGLTSASGAIGLLNYTTRVFTADAAGQVTKAQFSGGTLGETYTVTNTIETNETPANTLEASFQVLIQQE